MHFIHYRTTSKVKNAFCSTTRPFKGGLILASVHIEHKLATGSSSFVDGTMERACRPGGLAHCPLGKAVDVVGHIVFVLALQQHFFVYKYSAGRGQGNVAQEKLASSRKRKPKIVC